MCFLDIAEFLSQETRRSSMESHSFNKYLSRPCCVSSVVPDTEDAGMNEIHPFY